MVVDLKEALKKSLEGGGGPSRDKPERFPEAHGRGMIGAKPMAPLKGQSAWKAVETGS